MFGALKCHSKGCDVAHWSLLHDAQPLNALLPSPAPPSASPPFPLQARTAHEAAQAARNIGRARKGVEDALSRAAAAGGTLTLRSAGNKRGAASQAVGACA